VIFCDLRGFTAFAGNAEADEVMGLLQEYYEALGAMLMAAVGADGFVIIPASARGRCRARGAGRPPRQVTAPAGILQRCILGCPGALLYQF
jgi:hypothetical protein